MQVWRLIPCLDAPGKLQMALDQWLFDQHCQGSQPSILRFYTWSPPAISLGHHQRHWPTAWNSLPLDLVRRPTGGRAVLHQGDLTYAVITSGFTGNRMQAYREICEFLIQGWRSLGVELSYGTAGRGYIHNPNCFGTATGADLILSNGVKLIGSAQLWRHQTVLQHGSISLNPDPALFEQVFGPGTCQLPELKLPQTGAEQREMVITALVQAAQQCFATNFQIEPLTDPEWQNITKSLLIN